MKNSCAKLLAAKFKLKSVNKIFSEFGEDLKEKNKTAFLKPRYKMNI
jgi:hypothetical protein